MLEPSAVARDIVKTVQRLKGERGTQESVWDEIYQYLDPRYATRTTGTGPSLETFQANDSKIFHSGPITAVNRFAAVMVSSLTPPSSRWHHRAASDPVLRRNRQVQLYLGKLDQAILAYRSDPGAGFHRQNFAHMKALGLPGVGITWIGPRRSGGKGLSYVDINVSEIFLRTDAEGRVRSVFRKFWMTGSQAAQVAAKERWAPLPDAILKSLETGRNPDEKFEFIHAVVPREDRDPFRIDAKGMPIAEYYIASSGPTMLRESGFRTMPYIVSRWEPESGSVWPRSIAMEQLPNIRMLNEMVKDLIKQSQRAVTPVLLAHDDDSLDAPDLEPGAVNWGGVSADGRPLIQELPTGRIDIGDKLIAQVLAEIQDAFLNRLYQILVDLPEMTAYQVSRREQEKSAFLAPIIIQQQCEYLDPMGDRELDVLMESGLLELPPAMLGDAELEYTTFYDSPFTRSMRAEEDAGLADLLQLTTQLSAATQDPTPLFWLNHDEIIPSFADNRAVPSRYLNDPKVVAQMKAAHQQAQQQQAMVNAGPSMAAVISAGAKAAAAKGGLRGA